MIEEMQIRIAQIVKERQTEHGGNDLETTRVA